MRTATQSPRRSSDDRPAAVPEASPAAGSRSGEPAFLALATSAYLVLVGVYLWPLWRRASSHIIPDPGDPIFNVSILTWVSNRLFAGGEGLWSPTFFYPAAKVLTYSDHLIGPGLFFGLVTRFGGSLAAGYNTIFGLSFVLSGGLTCWVMRKAGHGRLAAFVAGLCFAFAPYRWDQLSHLQMLLSQFIPAVLWFWHDSLQTGRWRSAAAFLAFYTLHVLGGNYLAFLIHLPLALMLLIRLGDLRARPLPIAAGVRLTAVVLIAGTITLALFFPYLSEVPGVVATRTVADFHTWGATLASFFTPTESWGRETLAWVQPPRRPENTLGLGLPFLLLALLGGAALWRRHYRPAAKPAPPMQRLVLAALAAAALTAYLSGDVVTWMPRQRWGSRLGLVYLGLGLAMLAAASSWVSLRRHWTGEWPLAFRPSESWTRAMLATGVAAFCVAHPAVYTVLARTLPGFDRMRVPTRIFPILLLPLCVLAAAGCDELLARAHGPRERRAVSLAVILAVSLSLAPSSVATGLQRLPGRDGLRRVYSWISAEPAVGSLLELPVYADERDLDSLYAWLYHGKPILNGYSGLFPAAYSSLVDACAGRRTIPAACVQRARALGATHLVLHSGPFMFETYRNRRRKDLEPAILPEVELVYADDLTRVYRFR